MREKKTSQKPKKIQKTELFLKKVPRNFNLKKKCRKVEKTATKNEKIKVVKEKQARMSLYKSREKKSVKLAKTLEKMG